MSDMELASDNDRITCPNNSHAETAAFNLVGELLATVLARQDEEIIVESRSQDFIYNPETNIGVSQSLNIVIDSEDVLETEDKIEVHLSGIVKNEKGQRSICTLYFCLWWDNTANSLFRNGYAKTMGANSAVIELQNCLEGLADSVFALDLYKNNQAGIRCSLGHGRGYVVFARRA